MIETAGVQQLQPELRSRLFRKFEYVPIKQMTSHQYETCLQLVAEGLLRMESIESKGPCFFFDMPTFQHAVESKVG